MEHLSGYLGTYRVLVSDAVVLTMAEPPLASHEKVDRMIEAIREIKPVDVVPVVLRPRPVEDVTGARVALFTTAADAGRKATSEYLEEHFGCEVVHFSNRLSSRPALLAELQTDDVARADVYLTEIKAAAVDVVLEEAYRRGVRTVFMDNEPVEVPPAAPGDLDRLAMKLAGLARQRFAEWA